MASRIQTLEFACSTHKQSNISTAATNFIHFDKLDADITSPNLTFESDAGYIGKGGPVPEFATETSPVAWDTKNKFEMYTTAEFALWTLAYGLGNATVASHVYTINPLDVTQSLELPYFTLVEQLQEGGGSAIDSAYVGCAIDNFQLDFNSGPGRQSCKLTANWIGSGHLTSPSTVSIPTLFTPHYTLAGGMGLTINGEDYVAAKTIVNGSWKWNNNLLVKDGYFPGSGLQNGGQVLGRIETGDRTSTFEFEARLLSSSTEFSKLVAGTTGTAVLTFGTAPYTFTVTFAEVQFTSVINSVVDGLATVKVQCLPIYNGTALVTVTGQAGTTNDSFAQ